MSIATEIENIVKEIPRLQTAKANIKAAIENKGVTVGDETIDTYAQKIGEISGTGLPKNILELNSGSWTQATGLGTNGTLDVEHGLTDTPDVIVITSDAFDVKPTVYNLAAMFYIKASNTVGYAVYYNNAISTKVHYTFGEASQGITLVDNNKFTITTAGNRALGAGVTYSWFALRWSK